MNNSKWILFFSQCDRDGTQIYCNYYWGEKRGKRKELPGLLIGLEFICRIQNAQIHTNTHAFACKSASAQIWNTTGVHISTDLHILYQTQFYNLHTLDSNGFYLSLQKLFLCCCFAVCLVWTFGIWLINMSTYYIPIKSWRSPETVAETMSRTRLPRRIITPEFYYFF